jgi:plastocyanin domain-containing protein
MTIVRALLALSIALASVGATRLVVTDAHAEEVKVREIEVVVDRGYQPSRIVVQRGERVRLKFVRKDYSPCTREVVFPSLDIRRDLPLNEPVFIDLPVLAAGETEFHCGMNMVRGTIVVETRG